MSTRWSPISSPCAWIAPRSKHEAGRGGVRMAVGRLRFARPTGRRPHRHRAGADRAGVVRRQADQAADRVLAHRLRLRHLWPAAGAAHRQIPSRPSGHHPAEPAGRRLAQPGELSLQRGRPRRDRDRHHRPRRRHGAADRRRGRARQVRFDQVRLARQHEQRGVGPVHPARRAGREPAGDPGRRAPADGLDRRRRRPAGLHGGAEFAARHQAQADRRLSGHAGDHAGDRARRARRHRGLFLGRGARRQQGRSRLRQAQDRHAARRSRSTGTCPTLPMLDDFVQQARGPAGAGPDFLPAGDGPPAGGAARRSIRASSRRCARPSPRPCATRSSSPRAPR